jgi:curved DNA-binding protein
MAVKYQDYYEILGVPRDASQEKIQSSFRGLARKYHPDINKEKGAEDKFKRIGEAYEVLGDPDKRKKYDQLGMNWHTGDDFSPPPGWNARSTRGPSGQGGFEFEGFGEGFSDFFESIFGGFGRPRGAGPGAATFSRTGPTARKGQDLDAELTIPLEDAYSGARRSITLKTVASDSDGRSKTVNKTLEVAIPKGVVEGKKLRLGGQGGEGSGGGKRGDLYLTIHMADHPRFRNVGKDLEVDVPVTPWEAALGAKIGVPLVEGTAQITLPSGITSGKKLRVRGKGLGGSGEERGNLYAIVKIVVPDSLSAEERRLFEELAQVSRFSPRG